MPNSQNGWPVVAKSQCDTAPLIRDVTFPNGVLAGDVATIARWQLAEYDRRVERVNKGECWGWYVKNIEGSSTISNHASATAWDINAPDNPMGSGTTKRSMTAAQIAQCHAIENESHGVLRWGGDFSRNDPMHWEIVGSRAAVRALAAEIRADNKPPRKVDYMRFTVQMPVLKEGDDDAKLPSYNLITRIQLILGIDADGIWGPKTTAAIAKRFNGPVASYRTMNEAVWRELFGLDR